MEKVNSLSKIPLSPDTDTSAEKTVACGSVIVIIKASLRQHIPRQVPVGEIHFHSASKIDFFSPIFGMLKSFKKHNRLQSK